MFKPSQSKQIKDFFWEKGYVHVTNFDENNYKNLISETWSYYDALLNSKKNKKQKNINYSFLNSEGKPRHLINIFRDKFSPALSIFRHSYIIFLINLLAENKSKTYFTHSKISLKTPGQEAKWVPHQDSGYQVLGKNNGFAIFICLENMDIKNGALKVFPYSHKYGPLPHIRKTEGNDISHGQYLIDRIPDGLKEKTIEAKKGDIILFHNDTIHFSGNSSTNSRRYAIISEVKKYCLGDLDDYGLPPIFCSKKKRNFIFIFSCIRSLFSPLRIWWSIKKNKRLAIFIRKYFLSPLNLG